MSNIRYVVGGSDGWLNAKREGSGAIIALPEMLQVEFHASADSRDQFTVQEGVERGKKFSVKSGYLKTGNPGWRGTASLQFSLGQQRLTFPGGQIKAITHPRNPIRLGSHPIQLPDFPHSMGAIYSNQSPYAKTWFYLGQGHAIPGNNDRYLHPGSVSAGCITVDPGEWTTLYKYLILCRRGDGTTMGTVTVVR
ncbi:hypothetical protein [Paracidovorax anthurii]|uniref:L,D-transpeptidase-like protein n=1 Tax=Paracidovorax anthurii TaxID=78229 RepID=A0A328ZI72_9BURK|nr:hypothetical protein [Paracidovorax anthurii]RAR84923.1 hypothetical protein AX018_100813 [Paracidovorax anthurii]